ncbi:Movement protein [Grapevine virus J]|uniref:Movement protein n=1 Tax=Grapevine virus J TaxID=2093496 RepID=A0A2P1BXX2_9VIRU|nr:Movement protein [Grapevine virus J]AVI69648.1 Movement protein [Grapevine virus J]
MAREVKVFKISRNTESVKGLLDQSHRKDVYDLDTLERWFPKRTRKCVVHKEIVVVDGEVDCNMELMEDEDYKDIDPNEYPMFHVGCVLVAVMPHGRKLNGELTIEVHDKRLKEGKSRISGFNCDLSRQISAFAEFPGYFISSHDLLRGYSLQLLIHARGLDFKDNMHPFSVQLMSIGRFCGEDMESRFAISQMGKSAYQCLLGTSLADPRGENLAVPKGLHVEEVDSTLVKSDVYETIKKLGLKTHGRLIEEPKDQGGDQDARFSGRQTRRET